MAETKIVVTADTRQAERALGNLQSALAGLVSVAAVSGLAKQFMDLADSSANLQNKLGLVTQEGQSSNQLFLLMAKSAMSLSAPLKDVGDLFFRVANNTKDLGLAQTDQLKITETLIKGFQMTGASAGEVAGGVVQLGQAFSQGVLRGDELNSVLESLPMVADAIAAKFGVQRGALKALGEQGKITSKDLSDAILASGASIDKAWANKIPTIAGAFNNMQTALQVAVSQFDNATGASAAFSLAIMKITIALVKVIKFFEEWADAIKVVLQVLAALAAFTIVGRIIGAIGAAFAAAARWGATFGAAISNAIDFVVNFGAVLTAVGRNYTGFVGVLLTILKPIGMVISAFGALAAGAATFLGLGSLFPKDKKDATKQYKDANDELAKLLGTDLVQASNKFKAATGGLNAEQVKNAGIIEKANKERNADYQKLIRDQQGELSIGALIGDQLTIQQAIYAANKSLVKDIKNDKGDIIGQTKGLNAEETKTLTLLTQQSIELGRQRDIRQKIAAFGTSLSGSAAGAEAAGQLSTLAPIQAMKTANETLFAGLKYLRQNDLIDEQTYQTARLNATITAMQALSNAEIQQNANKYAVMALARDDYYAKTVLGQQAVIDAAKTRAEFEKKTEFEKASFVLDQGAQMFSALGAQNKKAFEAAKAFNIANAIMNTYMAATKALASYPPPFSFIAAAAAVGMGLAQVAQIRNQQYSGKALGGPVMGGTSYLVGENGPELFTPQGTGSITRNGDLSNGQPVNVNFTIVANDTTSFDTLLNNRKGMIKQLISDAMLDKGQRF
jgi:tape measure domain-containing protein